MWRQSLAMKKTYIILIIIGVALLGYYLYKRSKKKAAETAETLPAREPVIESHEVETVAGTEIVTQEIQTKHL